MGKKMKLPFLSKINSNTHSLSSSARPSWAWPAYCQQPRTISFRAGDTMFKTINSAYNVDDAAALVEVVDTPDESWFTNSSESVSFSTASDKSADQGESIETVIRGLKSERLFFEPGETSSILEEAKANGLLFPFMKESTVALSMESEDPYVDFKKSMEEMVEAHGLSDWERLEELLCCYLKVNGKSNHRHIIGAFVDLLVGLSFANNSTSTTTTDSCSCSHSEYSPSSLLSFYASSSSASSSSDDSSSTPCCVSSLEDISTSAPCLSSLEDKQIQIIKED